MNTLHIFTLVLDGMPFITHHLPVFERLSIPWKWHIVHGAAMNRGSTSWCKRQSPRLSIDGTTEYLHEIKEHPRVQLIASHRWISKDAMVSAALDRMTEGAVVMQIDSDEIWQTWQIEKISKLFATMPKINAMQFYCNFFVGPGIVTVGKNCYGNNRGEWIRAWRFKRGMYIETHEPPVMRYWSGNPANTPMLTRDETKAHNLVFDHYSYMLEKQVAYKEQFYGYMGAVNQWRRLQLNQRWPVMLKDFLPWSDNRAMANKATSV